MFGIGMQEMLLILAVALIVVGPKRLPEIAKVLGKAMGEFRKATTELKQSIDPDHSLGDVKKAFSEMNQTVTHTVYESMQAPENPLKPSTSGDSAVGKTAGTFESEEGKRGGAA
mgnify:CR=1 FL=1|uniref:Sec-independent protein translocase protein TatA n=1 Tax=Desulfatirhabdium butyrativorans TaxID=340467 RepID=A0A7C4VS80_9BACT